MPDMGEDQANTVVLLLLNLPEAEKTPFINQIKSQKGNRANQVAYDRQLDQLDRCAVGGRQLCAQLLALELELELLAERCPDAGGEAVRGCARLPEWKNW